MKWITKMVMEMLMEMALVLAVVLMETPEGGWRRPPEVIPAAFPPSDLLQRQPSVSCFVVFYVSPPPPRETPRGTIFIVSFRSKGSFGKKDRRQRSHEAQIRGSHAAKESGRVGLPILAFGLPLFRFLRPYAFFLLKNDLRKFSGHLDVVWVPETQKYRKLGFLSVQG